MTDTLQEAAQDWERQWWAECTNTFGEEAKQLTYAPRMGLVNEPRNGKWPVYDLHGRSVVDLGGGPASMLLKAVGGRGTVVDPCPYPAWVTARYEAAGVVQRVEEAETFLAADRHDEAWVYNVLQHVVDPERVVASARRNARVLRIFEWLETEVVDGHPHTLHADDLNRWIGASGHVGYVDENGATGLAYWGCFPL